MEMTEHEENSYLRKRVGDLEHQLRMLTSNDDIVMPQITIFDREIVDAEDAPPIPTTFEMPNELDPRVLANRLLALEEKMIRCVTKKTFYELEDLVNKTFAKHSIGPMDEKGIYQSLREMYSMIMKRVDKDHFEELLEKVDNIYRRLKGTGDFNWASKEELHKRFGDE